MLDQSSAALFAALATLIVLPLVVAGLQARRPSGSQTVGAFLRNEGRNGAVASVAGAVCGNIGIGSFIAIYLFAAQSPILGFSIVAAYTLGLAICAVMAPVIRRRAAALNAVGLIDLIAKSHRTQRRAVIWVPVAVVFILRSAVQLGALAFLTVDLFGGSTAVVTVAVAALIGLYLIVGGYRAAVETDVVQSLIIVTAIAMALTGLPHLGPAQAPFFNFAPYQPAILVGIWLFIPWSAILAVDNWQRITLAKSTRVAQGSYLVAVVVCGMVLLTIALAGYWSRETTVYDAFQALMPTGFAWLALAMFVACIMSSIDTFIMPLTSGLSGNLSLGRLRGVVAALVATTALVSIAFGDLLTNIVAAFNSLAVFLPAVFGALFLRAPSPRAAGASMGGGLVAACGFTSVDVNTAALVGFIVAVFVYGFCTLRDTSQSAGVD